MIVRIVAAGFVAYPFAVFMHVRGVGVLGDIAIVVLLGVMIVTLRRRGGGTMLLMRRGLMWRGTVLRRWMLWSALSLMWSGGRMFGTRLALALLAAELQARTKAVESRAVRVDFVILALLSSRRRNRAKYIVTWR